MSEVLRCKVCGGEILHPRTHNEQTCSLECKRENGKRLRREWWYRQHPVAAEHQRARIGHPAPEKPEKARVFQAGVTEQRTRVFHAKLPAPQGEKKAEPLVTAAAPTIDKDRRLRMMQEIQARLDRELSEGLGRALSVSCGGCEANDEDEE